MQPEGLPCKMMARAEVDASALCCPSRTTTLCGDCAAMIMDVLNVLTHTVVTTGMFMKHQKRHICCAF